MEIVEIKWYKQINFKIIQTTCSCSNWCAYFAAPAN